MEKNGLIKREPVSYDARLKRIILTEKSQRMVALFQEERERMEEILIKNLSKEEIRTLLSLLGKVSENLINYGIKVCE